jgi:hypothetical protein
MRQEAGKQQMELMQQLQYRAPFKGFDPRSFTSYWSKHKDPIGYLDAIGIEVVVDLLLNQHSPKQIATLLQVSQVLLHKWVHLDEEREKTWEWALNIEADNEMFEGRDLLNNVKPIAEHISKASKQAEHLRYMAKGFGGARWGNKVDIKNTSQATVTYNFNVALTSEQKAAIEGEARVVKNGQALEQGGLDLNELIGAGLSDIDLMAGGKNEVSEEEARLIEQEDNGQGDG